MIIFFTTCEYCKLSLVILPKSNVSSTAFLVDEDSLSTQDMADIEDQKPVLFDGARHKRHVCREDDQCES